MHFPPCLRLAGPLALGFILAGNVPAQTPVITGKDVIPDCPAWVHNAVVYQIYPQTFYDSNGDGVGDLEGIIQKLDYVKSLGVDAIWINPFFDSPFNDAGYDIRDYYKIAPRYGTNDDARRLFAEAHKRGLKVLFDYVISYTSIDNPWFVAACEQAPGRFSNWYVWTDNVWKPEWGEGWVHGYGRRNGNFLSNFFWSEPALNYGFGNPDSEEALAARRESSRRARVAHGDEEGDAVLDGSWRGRFPRRHGQFPGQGPGARQATKDYWHEVRQILRTDYPQAFAIAEWSEPKDALDDAFHACFIHWMDSFNDLYQKESWRIQNGMSDGHSFFDREGTGDVTRFLRDYLPSYQATRAMGYVTLPLGNHDIARINNKRTTDEIEMIMAFGLTMPGVPFIYYGNEIGMRQLDGLPQVEGAYKPRAGARSPMQWTGGRNLGFSTAEPSRLYLPVDPAADAPNVAAQEGDAGSLLNRVRRLIALKHAEPALAAYAEFVPLYARPDACPFVYARASGGHVVLAVFNPAARPASAEFPLPVPHREFKLLAGRAVSLTPGPSGIKIEVPGSTYALYRVLE